MALKKDGQIVNVSTRDGILRIVVREGNRPRPVFSDADLAECMSGGARSHKRQRDGEAIGRTVGHGSVPNRSLDLVPVGPSSGPSSLSGEIRKMVIENGAQ